MANKPVKNPFRSNKWRWERIQGIVHSNGRPKTTDDIYIKEGVKFLKKLKEITLSKQSGMTDDLDKLFNKFPYIGQAHTIHQNDDTIKWAIESLVLAEADDKEIAKHLNCDKEVVDAYVRLFYDIRDKLKSPILLSTEIDISNYSEEDQDVIWKIVGYFYGKEALMEFMFGGNLSSSNKSMVASLFESQLTKKALMSVMARPATGGYAHDTIIEYIMHSDVRNKQSGAIKAHETIGELLEAVRTSAKSTIGLLNSTDPDYK